MPTKNTAALSLPKTKTVRGCEIKRLPLGGYLQAVELLRGAAGDLLEACFPGRSLDQVLAGFRSVDTATVAAMLGDALAAAPKHVIHVAAELTGIDEQRLLEDPDIGLDGLVEILTAWVEVNRLGDFPVAVRALIAKVRTAPGNSLPPNTGSSA